MLMTKSISLNDSDIKLSKSDDDSNSMLFEGYACKFGGIDSDGDTFIKGAYKNVIKSDYYIKMMFNHRTDDLPIGLWKSIHEDKIGLYVKGEMTDNPFPSEVYKSIKHGSIDGLSVSVGLNKGDYKRNSTGIEITNISDMNEISIVSFPADKSARIELSAIKKELKEVETQRAFEKFLRYHVNCSRAVSEQIVFKAKSLFFQGEPEYDVHAKIISRLENFKFPN